MDRIETCVKCKCGGKLAKGVSWSTFAPLDDGLSSGQSYQLFKQLGPDYNFISSGGMRTEQRSLAYRNTP